MIPREIFLERRDVYCKNCNQWDGVCLLGHSLAGNAGCPEKKFPGINGASYAIPRQPQNVPVGCGKCGKKPEDVREITWTEIIKEFTSAMTQWVKEGLPLADKETHQARHLQCKTNDCGMYKNFQCLECGCIVYLKTKVATEECPKKLWLRTK